MNQGSGKILSDTINGPGFMIFASCCEKNAVNPQSGTNANSE